MADTCVCVCAMRIFVISTARQFVDISKLFAFKHFVQILLFFFFAPISNWFVRYTHLNGRICAKSESLFLSAFCCEHGKRSHRMHNAQCTKETDNDAISFNRVDSRLQFIAWLPLCSPWELFSLPLSPSLPFSAAWQLRSWRFTLFAFAQVLLFFLRQLITFRKFFFFEFIKTLHCAAAFFFSEFSFVFCVVPNPASATFVWQTTTTNLEMSAQFMYSPWRILNEQFFSIIH